MCQCGAAEGAGARKDRDSTVRRLVEVGEGEGGWAVGEAVTDIRQGVCGMGSVVHLPASSREAGQRDAVTFTSPYVIEASSISSVSFPPRAVAPRRGAVGVRARGAVRGVCLCV